MFNSGETDSSPYTTGFALRQDVAVMRERTVLINFCIGPPIPKTIYVGLPRLKLRGFAQHSFNDMEGNGVFSEETGWREKRKLSSPEDESSYAVCFGRSDEPGASSACFLGRQSGST